MQLRSSTFVGLTPSQQYFSYITLTGYPNPVPGCQEPVQICSGKHLATFPLEKEVKGTFYQNKHNYSS